MFLGWLSCFASAKKEQKMKKKDENEIIRNIMRYGIL